MNTFLRRLNILNWPLWAKFTAGFGFAVLLPIVLMLIIGWNGIREVGLRNVQSYILESGIRQRQSVTITFNQALEELNTFVNVTVNRRALLQSLQTGLSESTRELYLKETTQVLEDFLATRPEPLYSNFWIVDRQGSVIVVSGANPPVLSGQNVADSPAFNIARSSEVLGKSQALAVSTGEIDKHPIIEVVNLIHGVNNVSAGYLVTRLNLDRVIYNNLVFNDTVLPAYSFLVAPNGTVISDKSSLERVRASASSAAVERARAGAREVAVYNSGPDNNQEVVGYYAPITLAGDIFALVTEVSSDTPSQQVSSYLGNLSFPLVVGSVSLTAVLVLLLHQLLAPPLFQLRRAIQAITEGNFSEPVAGTQRGDEIGAVAAAFVDMREQVRSLIEDLNTRMAARVREVEATQEISRFAATQRDLQALLNRVVSLIIERFPNIYHAQIFLNDPDQQYAVLRASTGEAGEKLLARGHRLEIGSISVVGRATEEGQVIIARDTATSQVFRKNEYLPETRAELAIPLSVGDSIIGVLDVQSKQVDSFTPDQVRVLQTMADQIAVAIQNAQLYQESLRRLEEIENINRAATRRAWEDYMASQRVSTLSSQAGSPTGADISDLRRAALAEGKVIVGQPTERQTIPLAMPIQLRGQSIGAVEWELPLKDFNTGKVQLAQELVNRLAVSLENARLFQESRQATERERLVNTIAAKLTQQTDIHEILQTAVREVGQALRAPQVNIRLHWANGTDDESPNGTNGNSQVN